MRHSVLSAAGPGAFPISESHLWKEVQETIDPARRCPWTVLWLLQIPRARAELTRGPTRSPSPCPRRRGAAPMGAAGS